MTIDMGGFMQPAAPAAIPLERVMDLARERAELAGTELTDEHERVMDAIFCKGRNVFITGGAGVGKTMLVRDHIIAEFERRGYAYAVCATTGIAGSHLSGRTIHSFMGIGLGPRWAPGGAPQDMDEGDLEEHYRHFADSILAKAKGRSRFQNVIKRLRFITHIILDEVSMMPGNALLGFIDYWCRLHRKNDEPFGGIKMIFCGDFLQLPSVCASGTRSDWAFLSYAWQRAEVLPVELTKIFRQTDRHFTDLLNRVRRALPFTPEDIEFLRSRVVVDATERIMRTALCSTNREVDRRNEAALLEVPGEQVEFAPKYTILPHHIGPYDTEESIKKDLLKNKPLKEPLKLKIGLPVLITMNGPEDAIPPYFNGSRGTVVSMPNPDDDVGRIVVRLDGSGALVTLGRQPFSRNADEDPSKTVMIGSRMQPEFPYVEHFPIIPASGLTVHRSQGMSLDECMVDLGRAFAPGQVYVALSRLRTPDGLWLASDSFKVEADKYAVRYYDLIAKGFYK